MMRGRRLRPAWATSDLGVSQTTKKTASSPVSLKSQPLSRNTFGHLVYRHARKMSVASGVVLFHVVFLLPRYIDMAMHRLKGRHDAMVPSAQCFRPSSPRLPLATVAAELIGFATDPLLA